METPARSMEPRTAEVAASHPSLREHWNELGLVIEQLQSTCVSQERIFGQTATRQNQNPLLEATEKTVRRPGWGSPGRVLRDHLKNDGSECCTRAWLRRSPVLN